LAKIDWDTVSSFIEGVGTTDKIVTFPKVQDVVKVANKGNVDVIYTIGTKTGTLSPSDMVEVIENISSFTVRASSGTSEVYVRASEAGTEKEEIPSDIPADIAIQLNELSTSVAQKAKQSDLDQTNNNISATNLRVDGLVINSGDANVEVTDAHVSTFKNKTFTTVRNRLEEIEKDVPYFPITNLISNGYFSNGTTGWVGNSASTISATNNVLSVTGTGTGSQTYTNLSTTKKLLLGTKEYITAFIRVTNANCTKIQLASFGGLFKQEIVNPVMNEWYQLKLIAIGNATTNGTAYAPISVWSTYADAATALNKVTEIKYVLEVDLTKDFGTGKELSMDEMSTLLSQYPNSWFNGTENIILTKIQETMDLSIDNYVDENILKPFENLYNKDGELLDGYIFLNGNLYGAGSYKHQIIPVEYGQIYNQIYSTNIAFLDAEKKFVSALPLADYTNGIFTVPNNSLIRYVSLTVPNGDINIQYLVKGSVKPTTTPVYGRPLQPNILLSDKQKNEVTTMILSDTDRLHKSKKIMMLGDSMNVNESLDIGWQYHAFPILKPSSTVNVAVASATWTDEPTTVYDGNPTGTSNNVIGNQVQKIINQAYAPPDIIIIFAGTNDVLAKVNLTDEQINAEFFEGTTKVDLVNADRTNFAGAMRYSIETLRNTYPNAQIFICTPLQKANTEVDKYIEIKAKNDLMKKIAARLSVPVIDIMSETGVYGQNAIMSTSTLDHRDGLHLTAVGAKKVGQYIARKIINWYCF
jgi:lysophospholipase L1-like esterase